MRKGIKLLAVAFLISLAGTQQSCTKEKKEEIAYKIATSYINNGSWKVSKFEEDGKDETNHYNGYVFKFNTDGTVTVTKGTEVAKGSWVVQTTDDKRTWMKLNFNAAPFNELNEDWMIKSGGANAIQLEHTSGGNGGTDYLNFDKI